MNGQKRFPARILPALAAASGLLLCGCSHVCKVITEKELIFASVEGSRMDENAVKTAEESVKKDTCDAKSRARLLDFYSRRANKDNRSRQKFADQSVWFIAYSPADFINRTYQVWKVGDGEESYRRADKAWRAQLAGPGGKNPGVCRNAGSFYQLNQEERKAEELYRQAVKLEPDNPEWHSVLGGYYLRKAGAGDRDMALGALAELEKAMELTTEAKNKFHIYSPLAWAAYRAGEMAKAGEYAQAYLAGAGAFRNNWDYGNAIHDANTVLGLVAVSGGDIPGAVKRLAAAGETPGSPQLDSYGPTFELAAELLKSNERRAVLDYLDSILKFWKKEELVRIWQTNISAGQTPDFSITR